MHHPPYDLGVAHVPFQFEPRADAERLIEILNGHGNVIRVFCGHAHRPVTATLGKIPASTLPSIALDLRKGDYPPDQADAPLFQLHRYSPKTGFTSETRAA
jgi:hypothetical protein